jgi:hypothetical protein
MHSDAKCLLELVVMLVLCWQEWQLEVDNLNVWSNA